MHTLICGVTESGKTTMAHKLAEFDAEDRRKIIVYDPVRTETMAGDWPDNCDCYTDSQKFLRRVASIQSDTAIYIDEAGDLFTNTDKTNMWILTRGRHMGFNVTLICQRPKMLAPNARHQCARLFMFRLAREDARVIGGDYGHSDFHSISLDKGDFVSAYSGRAKFQRANIFELVNRPKGAKEWNTILKPPS